MAHRGNSRQKACVNLRHCKSIIFDMDGTLTRAVHDFDEIRRSLGLPPGVPILEALAALPRTEAAPKWQRLDAIELELAKTATASEGAERLLTTLVDRGLDRGIVTRNSLENAIVTLRAAGLDSFFSLDDISTRDNAKSKPEPDGLLRLCQRFGHGPSEVAMVGDYLYDLECGRRAGSFTVHYAHGDSRRWPEVTDLCVESFGELLTYL